MNNCDNNTNIGTIPIFKDEKQRDEFLKGQLELWREIRVGEKTWKDLNEYRQEFGFPDVNIDSLRRSFNSLGQYDNAGWINPAANIKESYIPKKDIVQIDYDKNTTSSEKILKLDEDDIKNPDNLLKAHGFDPEEWVIKQASNSKINRYGVTGDSQMYTSRIVVKPRDFREKDIDYVIKSLENFVSPISKDCFSKKLPIPYLTKNSSECLIVPLYDFHWGRLPETDNFNKYDIEEEKNKIIKHFYNYIGKFKNRVFNKVYLIVGQDFLNSSFTGYTSSQSHLQSNAVDFRTMFRTGCELIISIVNMFKEIGNTVNVIGSLGNHDTAEEYSMFQVLKAYYKDVPSIVVNDGGTPRKYFYIGPTCVGVGHLDKEKNRAFGLMQIEAKDLWAKTTQHIFIAGHLHRFSVENENGVELYRVPTICALDRWTVERGYTMNAPKTMCFIIDQEKGLIETHFMYL